MKAETSVRLGLMPPLSGVVQLYGQEITWAAQIACQEVNESGGVLGRRLELVIEDDGSLPESAVEAAEKLVEHHHCAAIIGNLLSNSRIAVAYRVAEPRRIPYLNFSFYEGSILSRHFFHFAALPNQQIDRMIPFMRNRFGPRMFFAGNHYEWPRGSIDAAKRALEAVGGEVVGEWYCPIGTSLTNLQNLLENVAASGADVFVPYFAGQDQLNLLTVFTEMGLKERMAVVTGHYDEMMASMLPSSVREGFYSSNTYFMTVDTAENRNYLKRLASLNGVSGIWPNGNGILTNFGEGAYLCVKAFAAAANTSGSIDGEALVRALRTISLKGPQGLVEMDPATHHAKVNTYLARCSADGTFSITEQWRAIAPEIPKRYRHMQISGRLTLEDDIRVQAKIVEHMTDCVCLIHSLSGAIIYCNAACEPMFGHAVEDLLGKSISILTDAQNSEESRVFEKINANLYQKGVWNGELEVFRNTGEAIWCAISVSAFTHAKYGEVWMAIFKDITERRKQHELLRQAKEAAERANASKSLFLAAMSHEIRTPLNATIGMSELLSLTPLSDEQSKYVQVIQRAGESLLSLINDLLDLSRAEQQGYTLLYEPLNLIKVVEDCIDILAPKAREKSLELLYEFSEERIPELLGDSLRIRQILFNLIGNAIKFTDQGGVFIKVELAATTDGELPFVIEVADTGIGIPEEFHDIIFEPFVQAEHALTQRRGGTGLGLSITRKLIEAMGGRISFESIKGQGSTFRVALRLQVAPNQMPCPAVEREWNGAFLEKKAILGITSPHLQRYLVRILESVGVIVTATSLGEVTQSLYHSGSQHIPYDFVILEFGGCPHPLQPMTSRILMDRKGHCPIIVHIVNQQDLSKESITASELIQMVKPIKKWNFLDELWSKGIKLQLDSAYKYTVDAIPNENADRRSASVLIVDDNPDNRFLVEAFLSSINLETDTAENGLQALEKVKFKPYDLIIMDIQMPHMDGYAATKAIRSLEASERRKPAVIITMTAYSKNENPGSGLLTGVNEHMTKPIKRAALIEIVDRYIAQSML